MANESNMPDEFREASASETVAANADEAIAADTNKTETAKADTVVPKGLGRLWHAAFGAWLSGKTETDVWLAVFLILLVMLAHVIRMVVAATPADLQIATIAMPLVLAVAILELLVFGAVGSVLGRFFRSLWHAARPHISAKHVMAAALAGAAAIFFGAAELGNSVRFLWKLGSQLAPAIVTKIQSALALAGSQTSGNSPAFLNESVRFLLSLSVLFLIAGLVLPTLFSYFKGAHDLLRNRRWMIAIPIALGLAVFAVASESFVWLVYPVPFLEAAAVIWFLWPLLAPELPIVFYLGAAFTPVTLFSSSAFSIIGGGFVIATSLATPFYFKNKLFRVGWWIGVLAFIACLAW